MSIIRHIAKTSALTDEKTLIHGCVNGLESYRYELYRRYAGKMLAVCKRYAGSKEDAEDYLQESFIKIFDKLNTYQFQGSLEGWIRRVVVHTCLNNLRSRKLYVDIADDAPIKDHNAVDALNAMSEVELMTLVQTLPSGYRTVFNMYAIDGYDHAEIAATLGINEGTSRSQLSKARIWLRNALEKKTNTEGHVYQAR
ncbi:MAG: RNA polymerase sigma factor [Flavobacteriales bacterium]